MTVHWMHDRTLSALWKGESFNEAQLKYDGNRLTFFKQDSGQVVAYGRDTLPSMEYTARYAPVAGMCNKLVNSSMPARSSIDGELWVPGHKASEVSRVLADASRHSELRFTAFAAPYWGGENKALEPIECARHSCIQLGLDFAQRVELELDGVAHDEREAYLAALCESLGGEGFVFKTYNACRWYKWKPTPTVDGFITGTTPGRGKYTGSVGSIEVAVWSKDGAVRVIASAGGMNDEVRKAMADDDRLLGRVVELEYQYVGRGGRLRHPRFKCFRPDKPSEECTEDQL